MYLVLCNCSPDEASTLSEGLVREGHAACVNEFQSVDSVYEWDGEMCRDRETTLLIKTSKQRYDAMKTWLEDHHSYDVPEIIAVEPEDVLDAYRSWVVEQTRS